ncbi:hypothetical protein NQD34_004087 [Periophthalmus magnuspinnatus]|nr:hypothetical protein NQD34_004087 [Periophthalmus magnuspinnatus]
MTYRPLSLSLSLSLSPSLPFGPLSTPLCVSLSPLYHSLLQPLSLFVLSYSLSFSPHNLQTSLSLSVSISPLYHSPTPPYLSSSFSLYTPFCLSVLSLYLSSFSPLFCLSLCPIPFLVFLSDNVLGCLDVVSNMELFGFFLFLILTDFSSSLDHSLIAVSPISPVSGVLLLTGPMEQYQFDFSEAQEACLFKNVSMATRPQLQKALDHGLEACRFGWLSEQIAAVLRLSSVSTCGSGKTGVVTWNAETNRKFGVWCFNASDTKEDQTTTTFTTTTTTTTVTTMASTTTTIGAFITTLSTTSEAKHSAMKPSITIKTINVWSSFAPWIHSTVKPQTPVATETIYNTLTKRSFIDLIHPSSTFGSTSTSKTHGSAINSESVPLRPPPALSTALIIFCAIVLVLMIGGAFFFYKLSDRCGCSHTSQKDHTETEMWKIQEEEEARSEREEEEEREEKRFTICSETMLYANPDTRMD